MFFTYKNFISKVDNSSIGISNDDKNQPFDDNAKNNHSNACVIAKQTTNFDPQQSENYSNELRSCHDNKNNNPTIHYHFQLKETFHFS